MASRITVTRIKLNRQGYTSRGDYYGSGEKLWHVDADTLCGGVDALLYNEVVFRAPSYAAARKKAKALVEKAQAKCEAAAKTDWGRKKYGLGGRKRRRSR